jgi:hypothetical protein
MTIRDLHVAADEARKACRQESRENIPDRMKRLHDADMALLDAIDGLRTAAQAYVYLPTTANLDALVAAVEAVRGETT